jgi:CAAX protease family protein
VDLAQFGDIANDLGTQLVRPRLFRGLFAVEEEDVCLHSLRVEDVGANHLTGMSDVAQGSDNSRPRLALTVFILTAFVVPWTGWIIQRRTIGLDHMFDSFGTYWFSAAPSVAGFFAAAVGGGWKGLRCFSLRVFNLRFPVRVWLLALFLPLAAALLTFSGHPTDLWHGGTPKFAAALATASLANFFTGPIAEEFGWRGYLLERLCRHRRPVVAGLLIGPIWAAWHIPLFYDNVFAHVQSALGYLAWVTAWSVVLAVIVTHARGGVLPSILAHWFLNALPPIFFALLPGLPGEGQPGGVALSIASVAVATAVACIWWNVRWQPAPTSIMLERSTTKNERKIFPICPER